MEEAVCGIAHFQFRREDGVESANQSPEIGDFIEPTVPANQHKRGSERCQPADMEGQVFAQKQSLFPPGQLVAPMPDFIGKQPRAQKVADGAGGRKRFLLTQK